MKTIIYDDKSCSDLQAEQTAKLLLTQDTIYTGNMLVVDYARLMRVKDEISNLTVIWYDGEYYVNEYGAIGDIQDLSLDVAEQILTLATMKRKTK